MKKLLSTMVLLCTLMFFSNAQTTVSLDSADGGQLVYFTKATLHVPDSSTVRVRNIWSFQSNFGLYTDATGWDTITNPGTAYTQVRRDTIHVNSTNNRYTKYQIQLLSDTIVSPIYNSVAKLINNITDSIVLGTLSLTATQGIGLPLQGKATWNYNTGHDPNAAMRVIVAYACTDLSQSPTLQDTIIHLNGNSGTYTHTFDIGALSYFVSYQGYLQNSVGTAYSDTGWLETSSNANLLSISQPDSTPATDHSITARTWTVSTGAHNLRGYIALQGGLPFDSVDQTTTGNGNVMSQTALFNHGVQSYTYYDVWFAYPGTSVVGLKKTVQTLQQVYTLNITTDTVGASPTPQKVRVYWSATIPAGTAQIGVVRAQANDLTFQQALDESALTVYSSGSYQNYYTDLPLNVPTGTPFRYKAFIFSSTGGYVDGAGKLFVLPASIDTVHPVFDVLLDTIVVTDHSADVVYHAKDTSTGMHGYVLSVNATVYSHPTASQTSSTISNLQPDSLYLISLVAQNNNNLYSDPQQIWIRTRKTPVVNPQVTLDSMANTICFADTAHGGGYNLEDMYGHGFVEGAWYDGSYGLSGHDIDTIHFISSTHCKVWAWVSYFDVITYTITNPGANPSNPITTQIVNCNVATGIEEVKRDDTPGKLSIKPNEKLLVVFPNPVVDEAAIVVGQPADYVVSSLDGKVVRTGKLLFGKNTVNLQQLASGTYYISTSTNLKAKIVKVEE